MRLLRMLSAAAFVAAAFAATPGFAQEGTMTVTMIMTAPLDRDEMLMDAVADGDAATVERMIELYQRDAYPWPTHRYDGSLLHIAAGRESEQILRMLLAAGFSPKLLGPGNRTPLHHAAFNERPRHVMLLLAAGADVDARTTYGMTPLHLSVGATTQLLLDAGADPHAVDHQGQSAVFYAGADMEALVKAGLDVNARNAAGWTPLHVAALKANTEHAQKLLDHGADIAARTLKEFAIRGDVAWGGQVRTIPAGFTALDIADNEHDEVKWVTGRNRPMIDLLRARGAKRPFLGLRFLSW